VLFLPFLKKQNQFTTQNPNNPYKQTAAATMGYMGILFKYQQHTISGIGCFLLMQDIF
jgi:hypothetical protein